MDINAFLKRKPIQRPKPSPPSEPRLVTEKPRITPAKGQQSSSSAIESTGFVLRRSSSDVPTSMERFIPKDIAPLPEDFDRVLDIFRAAHPENIPTDLGQGETITDPARFIKSHLETLELLRTRPSSMVFRAHVRRARLIALRIS